MVLSNKKLKQKLRDAKAEQILENSLDSKNSNSLSKMSNPENRKPGLSKREKRRQKVELENPVLVDGEEEKQTDSKLNDQKIRQKKRKRDQSESSEHVKEKSQAKLNKKKKTKNRKKPKKTVENKNVEEGGNEPNESRGEQILVQPDESINGKDLEVSNKVYVGGIPYYSTEDDIRSYFEACGTITSVDCMTFPDSGKFRGIAIIAFKTEAATNRALALDGSDMGGLFLKIQPFKSSAKVTKSPNFNPTIMEGYNRIYAGNLSWEITEEDLRKLFSDCNISSIRFGEDKQTGEFKGYAHVDFADSLSMNIALKLDQTVVCGRPVRITCAVPKKGPSDKSKLVSKDNEIHTNKLRSSSLVEVKADQSMVKLTPKEDNEMNNDELNKVDEIQVDTSGISVSSSKIRRRTCYECGERGHVSSLCPKKPAGDKLNPMTKDNEAQLNKPRSSSLAVDQSDYGMVKSVPKDNKDVNYGDIINGDETNQVNAGGVTVSNSKMRRRTCYECGERGHVSSLCPKNGAADKLQPVSKDNEVQINKPRSSSHVEDQGYHSMVKSTPKYNNEANIVNIDEKSQLNTGEVTVSSSKIRRRTCYECGEKGHISSLCPKIQVADSTNQSGPAT